MTIRKFLPGSEWLYLKIYTGVKTSDGILQEAIIPLLKYFKEKKYINQWFFIRYTDPIPHLRLRLKLTYRNALENINSVIKDFIASGEISNFVIDSYVREIERYGESTIEYAEHLFFKSSELILNFLDYDDEEKLMVSMFYIDMLLSEIKLSNEEKLEWISDYNTAFKNEFNADKNLNRQLDQKFRLFKPQYLDFVNSNEFVDIRNLIISNISESNNAIKSFIQSSQNPLSGFFQSIFHMHINRTFVSNQRLFEMIVYDYLLRHYKNRTSSKVQL